MGIDSEYDIDFAYGNGVWNQFTKENMQKRDKLIAMKENWNLRLYVFLQKCKKDIFWQSTIFTAHGHS